MDAEFVTLTPENLAQETLCCIVRTRTKHPGVEAKRAWLAERLPEGHVFCKLRGNGCAFVEYMSLRQPLRQPCALRLYAGMLCPRPHDAAERLLRKIFRRQRQFSVHFRLLSSISPEIPAASVPSLPSNRSFRPVCAIQQMVVVKLAAQRRVVAERRVVIASLISASVNVRRAGIRSARYQIASSFFLFFAGSDISCPCSFKNGRSSNAISAMFQSPLVPDIPIIVEIQTKR